MPESGGEEELNLEGTPTWIVAVVCTVIICLSFLFERFLHRLGKIFLRKNHKPLFRALQKVKGELLLMGFISLLLVAFQGAIQKICIPENYTRHMRPCKGRNLAGGADGDSDHCQRKRKCIGSGCSEVVVSLSLQDYFKWSSRAIFPTELLTKGKVPLLSTEAIHELHIFIFALAATQVFLSVKSLCLAGAKIHKWKFWENSIHEETPESGSNLSVITLVHEIKFISDRYRGIGKDSAILTWVHAFFKQFFSSVTMSDYRTMRLGFIMTHCKGNLKFNFHSYMIRALEADFKKVVGMSWYLWIYVIIFLLLNVGGWHEYFWLSFVPVILLLTVGTKLEHIITEMANEVAEKHSAIEGELVIKPSDQYFWFQRPRFLLFIIQLILFIVAFEIAYFLWIVIAYKYSSCMMDGTKYAIPRLVLSIGVRVICSYSTLPLYAIVTQMGSTYKSVIFEEHIREGLIQWAQKAKKKRKRLHSSVTVSIEEAEGVPLQSTYVQEDSLIDENRGEVVEGNGANGYEHNHAS